MSLNLPFKNINEFYLQDIIQDGPYTVILRGYQKNLRRNVLIKLLKPHSNKELKERFNREARVYAKLNHTNIVSVYALGEIQNYMYIILEFVHGCSLKPLLEKKTLSQAIIWDVGNGILDALKHSSEKKVVHRDIKPANIMIDGDGKVKVADFGLALISDEPQITKQQALIGTPAYMSPEQITGGEIDIRSDIFSFGSLLYEMIYQQQAFGRESYSESINSILSDIPAKLAEDDIPEKFKSFLIKCLQKDKDGRWASIDEALNEWQNFKNDLKSDETVDSLKLLVKDFSSETNSDSGDSRIFRTISSVKKAWLSVVIIPVLISFVIIFFPENKNIPALKAPVKNIVLGANDSIKLQPDSSVDVLRESMGEKIIQVLKKEEIITAPVKNENSDSMAINDLEPATLEVDIVPWARVHINDSLIDTHLVRQNVSLKAARYTLVMEHPKFTAETRTLDLNPGEKKTIHWSFWDKTGFLDLQVRPWADVYINNEYFDTTPFTKLLQLPVGTQVLELHHPALENYKEIITIIQSDTLVIKKNLDTQGSIIFE